MFVFLVAAGGRAAVVEHIDGTTLECTVTAVSDTALSLECPEPTTIALDELRSIQFARGRTDGRAGEGTTFYLAAGGKLRGTLTGGSETSVTADTAAAGDVIIPFSSLSGVWFGASRSSAAPVEGGESADSARAEARGSGGAVRATGTSNARALFDESLANRLAGKDVLVTYADGDAVAIRGRITTLGADGGRVVVGRSEQPFSLDRLAGIVFATGAAGASDCPVLVRLVDGEAFAATLAGGDGTALRFAACFGAELSVEVERIAELRFASPRLVYLSDLPPSDARAEGMLHVPAPARFDRNVGNGPLVVQGRQYDKGIGVHARSVLVYELNGLYEKMAATVGIDDAVRPRGSVTFRVTGDGRALYESDVLTGRDPGRKIAVDVRGVKVLELTVDYGPDMDLSDYADWCDARLIIANEE